MHSDSSSALPRRDGRRASAIFFPGLMGITFLLPLVAFRISHCSQQMHVRCMSVGCASATGDSMRCHRNTYWATGWLWRNAEAWSPTEPELQYRYLCDTYSVRNGYYQHQVCGSSKVCVSQLDSLPRDMAISTQTCQKKYFNAALSFALKLTSSIRRNIRLRYPQASNRVRCAGMR